MGVTVKADSTISKLLAIEAEEETHLRRRFHIHCILIGCAVMFIVAGSFGLLSTDAAAGFAASTEWCRAGIDHYCERRVNHD